MIKHLLKLPMKRKRLIIRAFITMTVFIVISIAVIFGVDACVRISTEPQILAHDQVVREQADCILVLGALVRPNGTPSKMLKDRLDRSIELYQEGVAPKILMSGDHGTVDYDEVNEMKQYAIDAGVPSEDIFMDHAGFSTYESVYRAKEIFGAGKVIIVTQRYHLYRALFDANRLQLDAVGATALEVNYGGQKYRDLREVAARNKDFLYTLLKVKPTYLGETISLQQSGDVTNDKTEE